MFSLRQWLFTIYKKIPEISVWNFPSVRVVYGSFTICPKIFGLSRQAGETDRLRFAISDSPVDTSAVYKNLQLFSRENKI